MENEGKKTTLTPRPSTVPGVIPLYTDTAGV